MEARLDCAFGQAGQAGHHGQIEALDRDEQGNHQPELLGSSSIALPRRSRNSIEAASRPASVGAAELTAACSRRWSAHLSAAMVQGEAPGDPNEPGPGSAPGSGGRGTSERRVTSPPGQRPPRPPGGAGRQTPRGKRAGRSRGGPARTPPRGRPRSSRSPDCPAPKR